MAVTLWTVRIAALFYAASVALQLRQEPSRLARAFWILGLIFFLIHVAAAFHYHHGWSHTAAYLDTARQTGEMFGIYWGGGLYLNYLFGLVWLADAVWRWSGWRKVATHVFMAFLFFNATVVFGNGAVRWIGLMVSIGLFVQWWKKRTESRHL